ncbi:MAG: hypothetical protein IT292_03740 [Deltaproteobacteria bacterium]|nr:hypothetical protein [Deltaproteobacteria bacterium]
MDIFQKRYFRATRVRATTGAQNICGAYGARTHVVGASEQQGRLPFTGTQHLAA